MNELLMQFRAEAVHVIVERPLECAECHRSVACLVNRDGRTRCYDCDAQHQDKRMRAAAAK